MTRASTMSPRATFRESRTVQRKTNAAGGRGARWSELSEAEQAAWLKRAQAFLDSDREPLGPHPRAFWYGMAYVSRTHGRLTRYPWRAGQAQAQDLGIIELPEVKP